MSNVMEVYKILIPFDTNGHAKRHVNWEQNYLRFIDLKNHRYFWIPVPYRKLSAWYTIFLLSSTSIDITKTP